MLSHSVDTTLLPEIPHEPDTGLPMRSSPTIAALVGALAKAQGVFPDVGKDRTARITTKSGASFSYTYADLGSILAAVRRPLSENELALLQPVHVHGGAVSVTTVLCHSSGEWVSDVLELPINDPNDARSVASAVTYARRYSLLALLAIAPAEQEDDDAEAATAKPSRPPQSSPGRRSPTRSPQGATSEPAADVISEAQRKRLFAMAREQHWSAAALKLWLATRGIESTQAITQAGYGALCDDLVRAEPPDVAREPGQEG